MRMLLCLGIVSTALAVALLQNSSRADETPATLVPADWQALHDRWQGIVDELHIPGVAVVAVRGDKIILLDVLGVCDAEGKQPVTPHSPFYLASVTKSFTALGVAILVDEGKVKLDEPVKTYLPRFTLADPEKAATITVRDLLCHRYGLNSTPISMSEAYFGNITDDRYYRLLADVEPQGFSYSNLHFTLAGRIIEAVTGQSWKDFLAERVFAPLGMDDSTCYASRLYANPLAARPIDERDGKWQPAALVKDDAVMHAAGGMGASAADLAGWLRFHLTGRTPNGRELISPTLLEETHKRQATSGRPGNGDRDWMRDGYSLGWFTGAFRGHRLLEHGGGYLGTSTNVSFLPDDDIGVAVLVNEARPAIPLLIAADVYGKLLDVETEDLLPMIRQANAERAKRRAQAKPRQWQSPTADDLSQPAEKYAGSYSNSVWGDAQVADDGGRLRLQVGELALRWHALGDDRFELEIPPSDITAGKFDVDADGNVRGFTVLTPMGSAKFEKSP